MSASVSDRHHVDGEFFLPLQSASLGAILTRDGGDLCVTGADGSTFATAPLDRVQVSARIASIPRRLTFPDGALFTTRENDGVDRVLGSAIRPVRKTVHRLERFHPRLFVFAAAVIALLAVVYRYGIPALTNVAVAVTPPSVSGVIGRNTLAFLDKTVFYPSELDEAKRASLSKGFDSLASFAEVGKLHLNLQFRKGGLIGPNALALPDGTVIVTDELVDLSGNEDEILGALAHEITHIEKQHSLQRLYRAAGVSGVIMFVGGDLGDLTQDVLFQGSALLTLSYSRAQEDEADARGVDLMKAAGRDPAGLAGLLESIDEACGGCADGGWWASHPDLEARVSAIRRRAGGLK